jgi:hypothetical protein
MDKVGDGKKKREKHFLFPRKTMGAKTQNGGLVYMVFYYLWIEDSASPKV